MLRRALFLFLALTLLPLAWPASAGGDKGPGLPPADLIKPGAGVAPAAVVAFLEGPAVDADGSVYFSDIAGNRILKKDPRGAVSVFRPDSGRTNGNVFDTQGRLI